MKSIPSETDAPRAAVNAAAGVRGALAGWGGDGWFTVAVAGFLAGYYLFPGAWWHGFWLWGAVLPALVWHRARRRRDHGGILGAAAVWLAVFFGLAVMNHPPPASGEGVLMAVEAVAGLLGVLTLTAAVAAAAEGGRSLVACQRWCVSAALVAAVTSLVIFYGVNAGASFGERLRNWFVHGGQHPVPTAITFGFAAVWAGLGLARSATLATAWRWGSVLFVLNLAVAFCQSRGASLAMLAATGLLALVVRRKRAALPLLWVVLALVAFHFLSQHLAERAALARQFPGRVVVPAASTDPLDSRLPDNGLSHWVERGDAGRLTLYRRLLQRIEEPSQRFWGKGWWHEHSAAADVKWPATHPHSVLVSTHYHGGQVALVGLLFLGGLVLSRAFEVWRGGLGLDGLVLFVYGSTALVFDGEALTSLFTEPRFESLVFWVPVGLVAGRYAAMRARMAPSSETVAASAAGAAPTSPGPLTSAAS